VEPRAHQRLAEFLATQPPGPHSESAGAQTVALLRQCWDDVAGRNLIADTKTFAWKLDRAENLSWQPPVLSFLIERHGGTAMGSTRAELHYWEIDVNAGTAMCNPNAGRRQVHKSAPRLDVKPIAEDIARHILAGTDHPGLKWSVDRRSVRLIIGKIIPDDGFKQTIAGRRKRFLAALRGCLPGWREVREKVWERTP
jgi:hypothetical protein